MKRFVARVVLVAFFSLTHFSCGGGGGGSTGGGTAGGGGGVPAVQDNTMYPIPMELVTLPEITIPTGDPLQYLNQAVIPVLRQATGIDNYLGTSAATIFAAFDNQASQMQAALVSSAAQTIAAPVRLRSLNVVKTAEPISSPPPTTVTVGGWTVRTDGTGTVEGIGPNDTAAGNIGTGANVNVVAEKDGIQVSQMIEQSKSAAKCPDAGGLVPGTVNLNVILEVKVPLKGNMRVSLKGTSTLEGHVGSNGLLVDYNIDFTYEIEINRQTYNADSGTMDHVPTEVYRFRMVSNNNIPDSNAYGGDAFWTNLASTGNITGFGPKGRIGGGLNKLELDMLGAAEGCFVGSMILAELALKDAEMGWTKGYCVAVQATGGVVQPNSETPFTAIVRHKFENIELHVPVIATLTSGQVSVSPSGTEVLAPATFTYKAPNEGEATVNLETRSNRGIAQLDVSFTTKTDSWSGTASGTVAGEYRVSAQVKWIYDPIVSNQSGYAIYHPEGTATAKSLDPCITIITSSYQITQAEGTLSIDYNTSPPTYFVDGITTWRGTATDTCQGESASGELGGSWVLSWGEDLLPTPLVGTSITGTNTVENITWTWNFTHD